MRVLVCGGREFGSVPRWATFGTPEWNRLSRRAGAEEELLIQTLDAIHSAEGPISAVIHGAARGADRRAAQWARRNDIPVEAYPADWYPTGFGKLDKSAGPRRNAQMLAEGIPDLVVAFPGGDGTKDMVGKAKAANVPLREIALPSGPWS